MNSVELDRHRTTYAERDGREAWIEELRRSRQYLAEAQKLTHTGSWAWSPISGKLLYWSEECYRILGFDPARGLPSFEASAERIHPEDRPDTLAKIDQYARAGKDFEIEYRLLLPDGVVRNVRIFAHPVRDTSGAVVEFIGTVVDITEQKRAEDERREHRLEARLQATLNMIPAYTYYAAPGGALTFVNERCGDYLGLPKDHPLRFGIETGAPWDAHIPLLHPDDREESRRIWSNMLATGAAGEKSFRVRDAQGNYRWFLSRAEPLRANDGSVLYWVGINLDIEELKQAEEERREHLWFLESMDRINRAMQRTNDVEGMTSGVLEEAMAIFGCDRAWLVYPCDPDSPTMRAVMEHTRPEFPGVFGLGEDLPVDAEAAQALRRVLDAPGAVTDLTECADLRERFAIQSIIAIAVRPKGDRPYLFGLHQCSRARDWTAAESRLFEEIARRLEGALTSVLAHRNLLSREEELRRSRAYLAEAQKVSHTGSWAWSPASHAIVYWSEECYRILGHDPAMGIPSFAHLMEDVHPEDRPRLAESLDRAVAARADWQAEYRLVNFAAGLRTVRCVAHPVLDGSREVVEYIGTVMDITEQKRAEEERREHLWFLESMDRINRAMQRTNDVEGMMSGVLEETLAIFGADRARLVYPCDPDAATCRVVMEHSRPEYPGAFALGAEVQMDRHAVEFVRRVLDSPGAATDLSTPEVRERFRIQSAIAIAVRPKGDRPYLFGLHQCSHARDWTAAERRLFEEIARRLEDALTSVLAHRNLLASEEALQALSHDLQESKAKLEEAQRLSHVGYWEWDLLTDRVTWSDENYRIYGLLPQERPMDIAAVQERIHPEDWQRGFEEAIGSDSFSIECRLIRPTGEMRIAIVHGDVKRDASGKPHRMFGTTQDITDRKRAEEDLRRSRAYLAEAQKVSHTGSWAWNNATREIVYWSEECFRIHGRDPARGRPSLEETMADIHPEDLPGIVATLENALSEGLEWEGEYRLTHFADGLRTVRSIAHPVRDASGRVLEYIGTVMDITVLKRAEEERREHLWFLESMDRINRAMQRTDDVESMTSGVLEEARAILGADRAWLFYPCDPDSTSVRAVMERTRPEYPGAFSLDEDFPVDAQMQDVLRRMLAAQGALTDLYIAPEIRERFSIQSQIAIAVRPKGDRPYVFGMHQCSHARAWSAAERRLFEETARRLEEVLTGVLAHRKLLASGEELRASEQRFRTFVDQASDAFFLYDDKHIVRDVNRQACESTGYTREELIGMHASQLNLDVTPETLESQWGRLLERGTLTQTGLRRRKDGSLYPVELRARVFSHGGRFFAIVSAIDITERKRRERCVLAQHRVTQVLSEATTLEQARPRVLHALCRTLECEFGVAWCVDEQAGVLKCVDTWSPSSSPRPGFEIATRVATFGPGAELPGRTWSSGAPVCIRDVAADRPSSRAALAAREGFHAAFAFPIALKSGVVGVIELFSREVRDADPELVQMMTTVGSHCGQFVERVRAEDALRTARSELAHVTRVMSMGELTTSIAHEVNQPLGAMVTSAASAMRWLAANPPNLPKASLALARIAVDGERAGAVIDRVRRLVKREEPGREPIDVNETIRTVVALMRDELERAGVAHAVRLAEDLPAVLGDRVLLQQVIVNLVLNAIDAMRGIEDRARVLRIESRLDEGGAVRVQVRDTGKGLPPDARLFEAFYTTKERGLGMGLSISQSIVEAHGGRMQARPNEAQGAIFEFSLPVAQP